MTSQGERLHKVMAQCGVASRRSSERLIEEGKVTVNGRVVTDLGTLVGIDDKISVMGRTIQRESLVYYLLHKPVGYLSSAHDDHGRRVVTDLVPRSPRVYPVGRLDGDSSGLLLLTNDGQLAYALTHPKFEVSKVYVALVDGNMDPSTRQRLLDGVCLTDGLAKADRLRVIERGPKSLIEMEIHQGRNRIVRRMLDAVDMPVLELRRERIGPLSLGGLPQGKHRVLATEEIDALFDSAGLPRREHGRV